MYEPVAVTRVGRAEGEMCAVLQSQGSLMDGEVLESYFFRLTQVAYISISVCCFLISNKECVSVHAYRWKERVESMFFPEFCWSL